MARPIQGKEKRVHLNLTLPPDLLAAAKELAREENQSLSALIEQLLVNKLTRAGKW